ncbi:MAG: aminotransferase class III-fold pyridoxal phosphate-dependent enzyme, partial [Muribaculaceae bacterium]|nr:aminotransferase class III-fold pyridoxal phosphate-dependent enzyme [Muribaculaceae bacterium]
AATDNPNIQAPFNKTPNVDFVPLNDIESVKKALSSYEYAAVIIEGIQGVAGIYEPTTEFMQALSEVCKETDTLLILDEIQSGYGRSGKFFAHQHHDIKPDIITCAKGIANGFPMGAVLIAPEIEAKKGMLGTTFGGNHLACAAAIAVLDIIEEEKLVENAAETGKFLIEELKKIPKITDVRGRGLMIGFEVDGFTGGDLRKKLLFDHHIFTGGAGKMTVRLLPALNLSKKDAEKFISELKKAIN